MAGLLCAISTANQLELLSITQCILFLKYILPPSDDQIDTILDAGIKEALENGVTQVHSIDMGVWDNLPIFQRAKEQRCLKIRVNYYTHISKLHELAEIKGTKVLMTIINGDVKYTAN